MASKHRTLGTRIRHAREVRALTQVALAKRLRIQQDRVSKWERDVRTPRVQTLVAIADSLDVSLDFLVRGIQDDSGL
jgi:transcriptional regulator with XRE-family HTH domain